MTVRILLPHLVPERDISFCWVTCDHVTCEGVFRYSLLCSHCVDVFALSGTQVLTQSSAGIHSSCATAGQ